MPTKDPVSLERIEAKLIKITQQFLIELGREKGLRTLSIKAALARDLGIDSLGKVELFHRAEEAFHIRLPQSVMVGAETLEDLAKAIEKADLPREVMRSMIMPIVIESIYDPSKAQSFVEILINRGTQDATRIHIYYQDENDQETPITYGQLLANATLIAGGLNDLGIVKGDTVAVMLPTCEDFFYVFMGILLIGAIPVPIYPPFRPDKIEEYAFRAAKILKNAQVRLLITFHRAERLSELLRIFVSSLKAVTTVDALRESNKRGMLTTITDQFPALIQYTSGSTALPKGVLLTHFNLLSNIRSIGKSINLSSDDVAISWLPLYHDMGLIGAWLSSFYHANPLVVLSPFTFLSRPESWLWAIHYHRGTLSAAPNFAYELCIRKIPEKNLSGLDLSSWRLTFNGAEAVNPKTIERFTKKFSPFGFKPQTMFPVYGLAESSVALTFPKLNQLPIIDTIDRAIFENEQRAVPVTQSSKHIQFVCCGDAIVNHNVRIVDNHDELVPMRKVGHLQFRGPSSMTGYYQQSEATNAIYHDGWWDSGDLAYRTDDGIFITGRQKDIIIKAGRNIHPDEIEEITGQVRGVRKGCVVAFGVIDSHTGTEKLVVVAETKETKKVTLKEITDEITEKITVVLDIVPDEIVLVPPKAVLKTSSGKLQRSACKKMYQHKKLTQYQIPVFWQMTKLFAKGICLKLGQAILFPFRLLYHIYVALLIIITMITVGLGVFILPYRMASVFCKGWAKLFLTLIACEVRVVNQEKIPSKRPIIYVANHASYIDSLALLAVFAYILTFKMKGF